MQVSQALRNRWVQTSLISATTCAVGGIAGYFLGKRRAEQYELHIVQPTVEQLELFEVKETVDHMVELIVDEDDGYIQAIVERQHVDPTEEEDLADRVLTRNQEIEDQLEAKVSVFVVDDGDWDYEAEINTRNPAGPYIIHVEEFIGDEMGYRQETVTFYAGDQIMSDNDETPLYGYESLMGELKFGHGSRNPDIVYIRNEIIHMEWEVLLDQGSFAEQVRGLRAEEDLDNEIRHSTTVQKFRQD